jgi:hypothetical protein
MGEMRNTYKILFGKPAGKRALEVTRGRWKDKIRMYLGEKYGGKVWTGVIWLKIDQWWALVNTVMNHRVP